jgi:hypothetical protein
VTDSIDFRRTRSASWFEIVFEYGGRKIVYSVTREQMRDLRRRIGELLEAPQVKVDGAP